MLITYLKGFNLFRILVHVSSHALNMCSDLKSYAYLHEDNIIDIDILLAAPLLIIKCYSLKISPNISLQKAIEIFKWVIIFIYDLITHWPSTIWNAFKSVQTF